MWDSADQAIFYADLGYRYHRKVQYEEAIRAYSCGLERAPNHDRLHCLLGLTLHNMGDHAGAIQHYSTAARINPHNPEAQYYLGFILIQESRHNEALEHLRSAIQLNPELQSAYHYLAIILGRLGNHKEAIEILTDRIAHAYPQPAGEVVFTLGDILAERRHASTANCHTTIWLDWMLESLNKQHLHCFGDSHRSVFNNLPHVTCYNVGAGTAYNLGNANSSTGAGNKILQTLASLDPSRDALLLVFGEIDCMEHIFKNSYRHRVQPDTVIDELVARYLTFVSQLTSRGYEVLIFGPSFSGLALNSYGDIKQRNQLVELFNHRLADACKGKNNVTFTAINDLLINPINKQPRLELSADRRHLDHFPAGSKAIQAIILARFLTQIQKRAPKTMLGLEQYAHPEDLASHKPWALLTIGSTQPDSTRIQIGQKLCEAGLLELYSPKTEEVGLLIDLLDHQFVEKLELSTQWSGHHPLEGKGEVVLISHQEKTQPLQFKLKQDQAIERLTISIEQGIGRAILLRLSWSDSRNRDNTEKLLLKSLRVIGSSHAPTEYSRG